MEGIGQGSVWDELKGQIYLGEESFLERMRDRVEGKAIRGIPRAQLRPKQPAVEEIINAVAERYAIKPGRVRDRPCGEAYRAAVYLMRPAGNMALREVAERAGVSAGRVSQIHTQIEAGRNSREMAALLAAYNLKP